MNYITDFMSKELRLIIEVDRIKHTYEEVLTDINGVRMILEGWIEENEKSTPLFPRQRGRFPMRVGMMSFS